MIIVIDGLDGGKFSSFDPVRQFPRALTFVRYFFDFVIEKGSLDVFNCLLELFPIFDTS